MLLMNKSSSLTNDMSALLLAFKSSLLVVEQGTVGMKRYLKIIMNPKTTCKNRPKTM